MGYECQAAYDNDAADLDRAIATLERVKARQDAIADLKADLLELSLIGDHRLQRSIQAYIEDMEAGLQDCISDVRGWINSRQDDLDGGW